LSNRTIVIGIGVDEVAVGTRRSGLQALRNALRGAALGGRAGHAEAPAAAGIGTTCIAFEETGGLTEAGALDALARALAQKPDGTGARDSADTQPGDAARALPRRGAYIVLDDFWANHAVLRGDFRALGEREVDEVARAHFADNFGREEGSLQVRTVLQPGGRALFASAVSGALIHGIRAVCASGCVEVRSLTLGLPQLLSRIRREVDGGQAMVLVVGLAQMHALAMDEGGWLAYDSQRLFPGEAADSCRIAALAGQLFERTSGARREDCTFYLWGLDADAAPLEQRFAAVRRLNGPAAGRSSAQRLAELAP